MIQTIEFNKKKYPAFQASGNAAQYIIPIAKQVCRGIGYDIGYGNEEWKLPNAIGIDKNNNMGFDADNLPEQLVNYIFSSHCLEHVPDWINTLDYWISRLMRGGVIFLYLPDYSQEYWRPWNNRKHKHILTPEILKDYFENKGLINIFYSGVDLNNSFTIMAELTQ